MAKHHQSIIMNVNSNFKHVEGDDLCKKKDRLFREYRRKWHEWPIKFYKGPYPLFIDVEATNACNLKCDFCATTFIGKKMKKGFMNYKILTKIVDEGANNGLYGVKFNIRGEPLLHPLIHEFVGYAKKRGLVDVYFNTNATMLSEDKARKLIDAGLDRISISVEGYMGSVYEKYRKGAIFNNVLSNIESLASLKKRLGVRHPKVRIQTVELIDENIDMDKYKAFWLARSDEVAIIDYKEMKNKKKGIEYPWACPQIWQRMAVWWDGTILPCNHDDDGLIALGNVKDIPIKDAWRCKKISIIRDMHKMGMAHKVPACDGCYLRDSEIMKIKAKGSRP
jgi:radical SAM protein with 4Fe4S-binding SPASM domain